MIEESNRGWEVALRGADWELTGSISRASRGWRIDDSLLARDTLGHEMHWSVPMPRGKWSGRLIKPSGSVFSAPGFAYQDHNWADSPLSDLVHGWSWFTLSNAKSTVIWANVQSRFCTPGVFSVTIRQRGPLSHRWALRGRQVPLEPENGRLVKQQEYLSDLSKAHYERRLIHGKLRARPAWGFFEHLVMFSGPIGTDDPTGVRGIGVVADTNRTLSGAGAR
jgi:hypothetical protein